MPDAAVAKSKALTDLAMPLQHCHKLGAGSFGVVYSAVLKSGRTVAIKDQEVEGQTAFQEELACNQAIVAAGCHINVLHFDKQVFDASTQRVFSYMEPGLMDLRKLLEVHAYSLPLHLGRSVSADLAQALQFLARLGVVHRDVKPSNCVLFLTPLRPGSLLLKLSDFGAARLANVRDCKTRGFCTSWYRAPEATDLLQYTSSPKDRYSTAVDVWAFGCILIEVACGRLAFQTNSADEAALLGMFIARIGFPPQHLQFQGWDPVNLRKLVEDIASIQIRNGLLVYSLFYKFIALRCKSCRDLATEIRNVAMTRCRLLNELWAKLYTLPMQSQSHASHHNQVTGNR
jgi:serine/threonine protein kinase